MLGRPSPRAARLIYAPVISQEMPFLAGFRGASRLLPGERCGNTRIWRGHFWGSRAPNLRRCRGGDTLGWIEED